MLRTLWKLSIGVIGRIIFCFIWLIALSILIDELETNTAIIAGLILTAVFLLVQYMLLNRMGWGYGRTKPKLPKNLLFLIIIALVLVLGDIFWVYHTNTSQDGFEEDPLAFVVLGTIAFPIIEEFGFRLWIQSFLEKKLNKILAIGLVAFGFAFFHKPEMPIAQLLSGILYGAVLVSTKSIWIPILLHMLHNGIVMIAGKIEFVKELSFKLMDRTDNLNLIITIILWAIAATGILLYVRWNKEEIKAVSA